MHNVYASCIRSGCIRRDLTVFYASRGPVIDVNRMYAPHSSLFQYGCHAVTLDRCMWRMERCVIAFSFGAKYANGLVGTSYELDSGSPLRNVSQTLLLSRLAPVESYPGLNRFEIAKMERERVCVEPLGSGGRALQTWIRHEPLWLLTLIDHLPKCLIYI